MKDSLPDRVPDKAPQPLPKLQILFVRPRDDGTDQSDILRGYTLYENDIEVLRRTVSERIDLRGHRIHKDSKVIDLINELRNLRPLFDEKLPDTSKHGSISDKHKQDLILRNSIAADKRLKHIEDMLETMLS